MIVILSAMKYGGSYLIKFIHKSINIYQMLLSKSINILLKSISFLKIRELHFFVDGGSTIYNYPYSYTMLIDP